MAIDPEVFALYRRDLARACVAMVHDTLLAEKVKASADAAAARYPVATGATTREEQAAQDDANERVLRQARRDVAARIVAGME